MTLSFIIPCYRESREQLNHALDSLLFLNALCDWEAWVVDDGSPEGKVCEWVAERNDRHLHAVRQDNQGLSMARNAGMDRARGEYVAFLDADDELIPEQYAALVTLLLRERPDVLGLRYKATRTPYYDGEALAFMAQHDVVPSACTYLIRRALLEGLRFTPGIYHEDEEFVTLLFLRAHRLIMTPVVAYKYNVTQGSIVRKRDEAHLSKRFNDMLGVIARLQQKSQDYVHSSNVTCVTDADSLALKALTRRIHVLAMCLVVALVREGSSSSLVRASLVRLSALHLYPLPHFSGIRRYAWIRLLTLRPWMVNVLRKVKRVFF